tara:strand:- start:210 stop:731 length:522 start_codon:yes stop_codon:yes gene_type:complete
MVEKIKTNKHGDCIYTEQDAIDLLYTQPDFDITKLFFESTDKYNNTVRELGLDLPKIYEAPARGDVVEFDSTNCDTWHMPGDYSNLNVLQWLLERCQNNEEKLRVQTEYGLFEEKKFIKVLQFLIYFVDTLRANNVVWGVGRGSSVASFCLFLIGVHKINPMLYNLDHREFLR